MSFLLLLADVLGPVVAVVAAGALVGPRLGLDLGTLSRLAYWVLGPAFVFDLFFDTTLEGSVALRLTVAALAGMTVAAVVAHVAAGGIGVRGRRRSALVLTGTYGNVGNAGLAISAFALGEEARTAAGVLMLVIGTSGIALGVALASMGDDDDTGRAARLAVALRRALLSPMPLATAAALAVNGVDVPVPLLAERSLDLLAGAMIPVMLFTLGLQLAQTGGIRLQPLIAVPAMTKLVVSPLATLAVATAVGLTGDALGALIIQAAMPPAVFCVLVGIEYDLEPPLVTDAVVATTIASLATLPLVLAFVT
ncbi:MAG: AEC family transporter [Actinomycetota bacterium]